MINQTDAQITVDGGGAAGLSIAIAIAFDRGTISTQALNLGLPISSSSAGNAASVGSEANIGAAFGSRDSGADGVRGVFVPIAHFAHIKVSPILAPGTMPLLGVVGLAGSRRRS